MSILTAWQRIWPEVIVKGFKKCCVWNGMDRIDDDMLWNGSEEDGKVKKLVWGKKGIDCEDVDGDTCKGR